jgi:tetratricopeptide (TPR) repeat protein
MTLFHAGARARGMVAVAVACGALGCVDPTTEHRVRANAFLRGGDAAAALAECDRGLQRKPEDVPLLILRGKALFELDRIEDARAAYQLALDTGKDRDPRDLAEAQLGAAMAASRSKDWPGARKHFEALVAINDRDATSMLNVARACLEMGDQACAVDYGERAGRLRGSDEVVLYTLGTIYLTAGKAKEAELTFQHICEVAAAAATCPYGLALVAAKAGERERALQKLGEAIERKVPNPESIAREPGFAAIKDDPRFAALVAKATAK